MIQIEIINSKDETQFVNEVNYFLEQLEDHLFLSIQYQTQLLKENPSKILFSALILYKVE